MKTMRIICLFICTLLFTNISAQNHYTKPIHKAYLADGITTLKLDNKYGNVRVIQTKNDSLSIEVKISMSHYDEEKAEKQIEEIEIVFGNYKKSVSAKTVISKFFKTAYNFAIDYVVSVPVGISLKIENSFGDIIAEGDLHNHADFSVAYGNIYVDNIVPLENAKMNYFKLNYSTAHLKNIYDSKILTNFSKIRVKKANNMIVSSRCSRIEVDSTFSYISNSQNDNCIIKNCDTFKIKRAENSHISLENGINIADINMSAGTLSMKNVMDFEKIKINSEDTRIDITTDESVNYNFKALLKDVFYKLPESMVISSHEKNELSLEEFINAYHSSSVNIMMPVITIEANKGYINIQ